MDNIEVVCPKCNNTVSKLFTKKMIYIDGEPQIVEKPSAFYMYTICNITFIPNKTKE